MRLATPTGVHNGAVSLGWARGPRTDGHERPGWGPDIGPGGTLPLGRWPFRARRRRRKFYPKGPAQGILPWKAQKQTKLAAAALSSRTASSACPPSSWCWCWRCWLACCRRRANSLAGILLPRATAPVSITCARTTCTPCHHDVLADLHSAAGTSAQSPAAERRLTLTTPAVYLGRKRWIQLRRAVHISVH